MGHTSSAWLFFVFFRSPQLFKPGAAPKVSTPTTSPAPAPRLAIILVLPVRRAITVQGMTQGIIADPVLTIHRAARPRVFHVILGIAIHTEAPQTAEIVRCAVLAPTPQRMDLLRAKDVLLEHTATPAGR